MNHTIDKYQAASWPTISQFSPPNLDNKAMRNIKIHIQHSRQKETETFFQNEKEGERKARENNERRLQFVNDSKRRSEILEQINALEEQKVKSQQRKTDLFVEMKKCMSAGENSIVQDITASAINNPYLSNNSNTVNTTQQQPSNQNLTQPQQPLEPIDVEKT